MLELSAKSALVTVTLISITLFSGALFGWATLQLIFEEDGVFSDGCEDVLEDELCEKQQNKFSLVYNVTSSIMAFGAFIWGSFVDRMGPVWSSATSGVFITTGLLLFGTAVSEDLASFLVGGTFLAVGGGLTLLNAFTLGYVLEPHQLSLVLSAVNCLFDASGATFLLAYLLFTHLHVTRAALFLGMAVLAAVLFVALTALWCIIAPELKDKKAAVFAQNSAQNQGKDQEEEGQEECGALTTGQEEGELELSCVVTTTAVSLTGSLPQEDPDAPPSRVLSRGQSSRTVLEKHSTPWLKEIQSRAFLFGVLFGSLNFFKVNVMFGTILDILKRLGDEDTGFLYTQIFVASLPLGFMSIPAITYCLQQLGLVHTFHVIIFLSCGYSGFLLIPVLEVQLVTFLFFTFFRAFLFSVMAYFSVHRFGPINSGKLYGLMMSMAGTFNFLNYPMVQVVNKYWDGDYFYYNLILLLFGVPLMFTVHLLLCPVVEKLDDMCTVAGGDKQQQHSQENIEQQEKLETKDEAEEKKDDATSLSVSTGSE